MSLSVSIVVGSRAVLRTCGDDLCVTLDGERTADAIVGFSNGTSFPPNLDFSMSSCGTSYIPDVDPPPLLLSLPSSASYIGLLKSVGLNSPRLNSPSNGI